MPPLGISLKKRKHSFVLVEILVAAFLAGILTTAALGLGYQCFKTALFYEKALEKEELHMANVVKLRSILRSIQKVKKDLFYVVRENVSDHLFFPMFAGIRLEIEGSNERYGQLYVNEKQELVFVYSSHSSKIGAKPRSDHAVVLWPNVQKITFSFVPNKTQRTSIPGIDTLMNGGGLLETWEKGWNELPAVIIASVYEKGKKEPTKVSSIILSSLQEIQVS